MNPWEKNNWYDFDSGDKPSSSSVDNRSDNQKSHGSCLTCQAATVTRIEDFLSDLLSRQDNLTQAEKSAPTVQALIGLASKWGVNPWEVKDISVFDKLGDILLKNKSIVPSPSNILVFFDTIKQISSIPNFLPSYRILRTLHLSNNAPSCFVLLGSPTTPPNIIDTIANAAPPLPIDNGQSIATNITGLQLKFDKAADNTSGSIKYDYSFQLMGDRMAKDFRPTWNLIRTAIADVNNVLVHNNIGGSINFLEQLTNIYSILSGNLDITINRINQAVIGEAYGQINVVPFPSIPTTNVISPLQFDASNLVPTMNQNNTSFLRFVGVLGVINTQTPPYLDALQSTNGVPAGTWIPQTNTGAWGFFRTAVRLQNTFTPAEQTIIAANSNPNGFSAIVDGLTISFYRHSVGFPLLLSMNYGDVELLNMAQNEIKAGWEGLING